MRIRINKVLKESVNYVGVGKYLKGLFGDCLSVHRADYWKSNPRKFCDVCKCWFGDNKAVSFLCDCIKSDYVYTNTCDRVLSFMKEGGGTKKMSERNLNRPGSAPLRIRKKSRMLPKLSMLLSMLR